MIPIPIDLKFIKNDILFLYIQFQWHDIIIIMTLTLLLINLANTNM